MSLPLNHRRKPRQNTSDDDNNNDLSHDSDRSATTTRSNNSGRSKRQSSRTRHRKNRTWFLMGTIAVLGAMAYWARIINPEAYEGYANVPWRVSTYHAPTSTSPTTAGKGKETTPTNQGSKGTTPSKQDNGNDGKTGASSSGSNLTIIAIGCKRAEGLLRTLNSVKNANVPAGATLHICVDGCGVPQVGDVAKDFEWLFGEKQVTVRSEPFGLAKHITHCWENPQEGQWALFVEDDVVLAPLAFSAFAEGLQIRKQHEYGDNIVGIALHDSRVNQYCWRDRIKTKPCPAIHEECKTMTLVWGHIGSLLCLKGQSHGSWILNQVPSSWGAFYEGKAWSTFKEYYSPRDQLTIGESLLVAVPHSFSNEWEHSWKRFFLELMFRAGWTFMYRVDAQQKGFATTLRSTGAHTLAKESASEIQRKCLVSLPLDESTQYPVDHELTSNISLMNSFDYCSYETSVQTLVRQAKVSTSFLEKQLDDLDQLEKVHPNLLQSFRILEQASRKVPTPPRQNIDPKNETVLSSGYDVTFLDKAEVILVTSFASIERDFATTAAHFEQFQGVVHFLVAAPGIVCRQMMRGNIYSTCLDEVYFVNPEGNHLPVIKKLLEAAVIYAGPNVKWIGVMNGDVSLDSEGLIKTLASVSTSKTCRGNDARCVVTGQRFDIDWETKEEKLHSEYGMDYFIFNSAGMDYMLQNGNLPPFTIGLVRWDSWLMGFLASSDEINTIDASKALKVKHFMNFKEDFYKSKTNSDLWNLKLADKMYRLGRTDNANYRLDPATGDLLPLVDSKDLQKKLESNRYRWEFDGALERVTNFTYTAGGMTYGHFGCLCDLLTTFTPGNVTVNPLGKYCAPSEYLKKSRGAKFGNRVFFAKEFFGLVAGRKPDELDWNGQPKLAVNASKCCVLIDQYEAPVRVPDKFWTADAGTKEFKCIDGDY